MWATVQALSEQNTQNGHVADFQPRTPATEDHQLVKLTDCHFGELLKRLACALKSESVLVARPKDSKRLNDFSKSYY